MLDAIKARWANARSSPNNHLDNIYESFNDIPVLLDHIEHKEQYIAIVERRQVEAESYALKLREEYLAELDRLEAGWMEFESIEIGTGNLRPSVKDLLRALEETREDNKKLHGALEAVEWLPLTLTLDEGLVKSCPWCYGLERKGHHLDCKRQLALKEGEW